MVFDTRKLEVTYGSRFRDCIPAVECCVESSAETGSEFAPALIDRHTNDGEKLLRTADRQQRSLPVGDERPRPKRENEWPSRFQSILAKSLAAHQGRLPAHQDHTKAAGKGARNPPKFARNGYGATLKPTTAFEAKMPAAPLTLQNAIPCTEEADVGSFAMNALLLLTPHLPPVSRPWAEPAEDRVCLPNLIPGAWGDSVRAYDDRTMSLRLCKEALVAQALAWIGGIGGWCGDGILCLRSPCYASFRASNHTNPFAFTAVAMTTPQTPAAAAPPQQEHHGHSVDVMDGIDTPPGRPLTSNIPCIALVDEGIIYTCEQPPNVLVVDSSYQHSRTLGPDSTVTLTDVESRSHHYRLRGGILHQDNHYTVHWTSAAGVQVQAPPDIWFYDGLNPRRLGGPGTRAVALSVHHGQALLWIPPVFKSYLTFHERSSIVAAPRSPSPMPPAIPPHPSPPVEESFKHLKNKDTPVKLVLWDPLKMTEQYLTTHAEFSAAARRVPRIVGLRLWKLVIIGTVEEVCQYLDDDARPRADDSAIWQFVMEDAPDSWQWFLERLMSKVNNLRKAVAAANLDGDGEKLTEEMKQFAAGIHVSAV
ncbi:hypothetical protein DFH27DRAFT_616868 [Peziza echinospora]|nr:hypothetical protein DFH27DRAFT_616868 [Peziza echinospora]